MRYQCTHSSSWVLGRLGLWVLVTENSSSLPQSVVRLWSSCTLNLAPWRFEPTSATKCPWYLSKQRAVIVITHIFCLAILLFSFWSFFPSFSVLLVSVLAKQSSTELTTQAAQVSRHEEVRRTRCPIKTPLTQLIQRCGASSHPCKAF